jgi:putative holliday junction resolvase
MKSKRALAIDYGTKRIGLALSDELHILATPIGYIENRKSALNDILYLISEKNVGVVILGLPTALSGGDSQWTTEVRIFGEKLRIALESRGIEFQWYDERLTSIMAETNIRSQGLKRTQLHEKHRRDEEAARLLLQEWLDKKK